MKKKETYKKIEIVYCPHLYGNYYIEMPGNNKKWFWCKKDAKQFIRENF
jgi:hypothetical protein